MGRDFKALHSAAQAANYSLLSAGLDICSLNYKLIREVADLVSAYKIDPVEYYFREHLGLTVLRRNIDQIHHFAPQVPFIIDAKYGGSKRANETNAKTAFDVYEADGATVNPYNGMDTFGSFLDRKDKCIFIVCKTSNEGSGEFQDRYVPLPGTPRRVPLYEYVAYRVATEWNKNGNCGLVVGAQYPIALARVRLIVGDDVPILCPGGGEYQGGNIEGAVSAGKNSRGDGLLMHFSRELEHAASPGEAAKKLLIEINRYRNNRKEAQAT